MPIKFKCPHCKKGLSVKEHLAGKAARCPACKQMLKIPSPVTAPPPADVDELAMSVLQEKPAEAPAEAPKTVDFTCPQCDEPVQAPIELAGKQMPCPHCRRIIKVPVPEKKAPTDWRQKTTGPSAARQNLETQAPEGAWAAGTTAAHRESLEEAGAIQEEPERLTVRQKVVRVALLVGVPLLLIGSGYWGYRVMTLNKETRWVEQALKDKALEGRPEAQAALNRAAGEYYLRTNKRGCADQALAKLTTARGLLGSAGGNERDLLLMEVALTQVDLGGTPAEVENRTRRNWVQEKGNRLKEGDRGVDWEILQTVGAIQSREARLMAVREVGRKLIAKGQPQLAVALTTRLDDDLRSEAAAQVGVDLYRSDPARAEAATNLALDRLPKDKKGAPQDAPPSAVALCLVLNKQDLIKKLPADAQAGAQSDKPQVLFGMIEGLGLQGKADDARKLLTKLLRPDQVQARLILAEVLAGQQPEAARPDVKEAANLVLDLRRASGWQVLRLIRLAGRTGALDEDKDTLKKLPDAIQQDAGLRAWAQLEVLRVQLAAEKGKMETESCEAVEKEKAAGDKPTAAAYVAREALARHNAQVEGNTLNEARKYEPEFYRPFGIVGAILGRQGGQ
jgi:hypothetical protein